MCDFRSPPTGVQDMKTHEVYPAVFQGYIGGTSYIPTESGLIGVSGPKFSDLREKVMPPGFYYICASGSFYVYWDGEQSWGEYDEYLVEKYPEEKWAQPYIKYKFFFPKEYSPYDCLGKSVFDEESKTLYYKSHLEK